jgi:hypothetical protein
LKTFKNKCCCCNKTDVDLIWFSDEKEDEDWICIDCYDSILQDERDNLGVPYL